MRRRALAGTVLAAVLAASVLGSPERALGIAEATAADPLLFGAVLLGLYLLRPLFLWPTTLLAVVVGYGYGIALGVPVALAGAVLTSLPPFYAARAFGSGAPFVGRLRAAGERFLDATGHLRGVTAGRLAPVPADAVTCAAAISGVRLRTFVAGVLAGELPWTAAAVVVGSSLATITAEGLGAVGAPLAVLTTVAAAALLAGPVYRHLETRDRRSTAS